MKIQSPAEAMDNCMSLGSSPADEVSCVHA
jgi:hypothetical protein